ncbi:TPA: hypothetical protein N0F65_009972 [Lagenidium giganteum]|uniref:Uncharacterized protein n=1 Tax=Lagenidium giganteum TaxID=4803 RepID=A0AAV2YW63_9STRA|nr:TPA: hypothetical protein N0F65_009972 [Lagenidium giganteum]
MPNSISPVITRLRSLLDTPRVMASLTIVSWQMSRPSCWISTSGMCLYTTRAASSAALFSSVVPLVSICSGRADSSPQQHACANCRQHREVLVALVHVLRQAATQFLLRAVVCGKVIVEAPE